MSLHTLAHHVQSAGRGDDKILVHMTPGEVKGLQAIAMAHGGSLTINPKTGLPEAGFLSSILPMVAGFALNAFLPGVGTAVGSALGTSAAVGTGVLVGGATGLATGSLSKGLMAGFGAYGGAGLSEGLAAAGSSALDKAGVSAVDEMAAANKLGSATTNTLNNSSYQGAGAAANATTNATTNTATSGGLQGYQGYNNIFSNPTLPVPASNLPTYTGSVTQPPISGEAMGSHIAIDGTSPLASASRPILTPEKITYAGSSNPYDYTSNLAKTYNDPLMEPQLGARELPTKLDKVGAGFRDVTSSGSKAWNFVKENPAPFVTAGIGLASDLMGSKSGAVAPASGPSYLRPYEFSTEQDPNAYLASDSTAERRYFKEPRYTALPIQRVASGGLLGMAVGGPVENMSAQNAIGDNTMYPQSQLQTPMYSNPMVQRPMSNNVIQAGGDAPVDRYSGEMRMASGGIAGSSHLGGYSDGGRLLRGPGDGVSDSIPAVIGRRQPARLADGEFVVPARIVSEIGNGSTEAGARKLYAMMDRVQKARKKSVGKGKVAVNSKSERFLPA